MNRMHNDYIDRMLYSLDGLATPAEQGRIVGLKLQQVARRREHLGLKGQLPANNVKRSQRALYCIDCEKEHPIDHFTCRGIQSWSVGICKKQIQKRLNKRQPGHKSICGSFNPPYRVGDEFLTGRRPEKQWWEDHADE